MSKKVQENEYKKWVSGLKMVDLKLKQSEDTHNKLLE